MKQKNKTVDKHDIIEEILKVIDRIEAKYNVRILLNIETIKTNKKNK